MDAGRATGSLGVPAPAAFCVQIYAAPAKSIPAFVPLRLALSLSLGALGLLVLEHTGRHPNPLGRRARRRPGGLPRLGRGLPPVDPGPPGDRRLAPRGGEGRAGLAPGGEPGDHAAAARHPLPLPRGRLDGHQRRRHPPLPLRRRAQPGLPDPLARRLRRPELPRRVPGHDGAPRGGLHRPARLAVVGPAALRGVAPPGRHLHHPDLLPRRLPRPRRRRTGLGDA